MQRARATFLHVVVVIVACVAFCPVTCNAKRHDPALSQTQHTNAEPQTLATSKRQPSYLILTMPRCSSTFLVEAIGKHPDATSGTELLHPQYWKSSFVPVYKSYKGHPPEFQQEELAKAVLSHTECEMYDICDVSSFREPQFCKSRAQCEARRRTTNGFKMFYDHPFALSLVEFCRDNDIPIIHLVRASAFRRSISAIMASQTRLYRLDQASEAERQSNPDIERLKVRADPKELRKRIETYEGLVTHWSRELVDMGVRHKTVYYEELRLRERFLPKREVLSEIFEFLGLDPAKFTDADFDAVGANDTISSVLDYASHIANMDELRREFPYDACELEYGSPLD